MTPERPTPQRERQTGIVIARPFGIPVFISPYWFLIAGLFVVLYANSLSFNGGTTVHGTMRYVVAAAFVILLYASVLVHELSHCVVARAFDLPVRRILLYPLGGFSEIEKEAQTPAREFLVSAAGPAISLVLAAIGYGLTKVVTARTTTEVLVAQLMWANLLVGLFNLLPGLPLDGGRMLRAGIWKVTHRPSTATLSAAWTGRVLAAALVLIPFALLARNSSQAQVFDIAWLAVIAAFMWLGAGQAIRVTKIRDKLPGLQARLLARRAIPIHASLPLAEAIRRADAAQARALVVVDHEDKPIAIVNESAVMATPPQRRPWIEAGSLARSLDEGLVLSADLSGMDLLDAVRKSPASEYLLVEPSGKVFGVLASRDLDHAFAGS
ncbi:MAG TPA: site-2 protease family protein [Streptosporangiaceae bacterium]|nr:site-2 protease family protein [Streptosporangiaceae bacterium]